MDLKPSFVVPSYIVQLDDFDEAFDNEMAMFFELLRMRNSKCRSNYFPDYVLLEDLWRIVDSFSWFVLGKLVTVSIPANKLRHNLLYLNINWFYYFLGYEDGSKMHLRFNGTILPCISGHYPFFMPTRFAKLSIYDKDPNKRVLLQISPTSIGGPWEFYFIWTKHYAQTFATKQELLDTCAQLGIYVNYFFHVRDGCITCERPL